MGRGRKLQDGKEVWIKKIRPRYGGRILNDEGDQRTGHGNATLRYRGNRDSK